MNVNNVNINSSMMFLGGPDAEEKRIARRLLQYGITPSGNKSADRAKLHEIELKEAKKLNYITNKFLTVTVAEQEKILEKKKEKREEVNPELYPDTKEAEKFLGEQIYLAIRMKKNKKN